MRSRVFVWGLSILASAPLAVSCIDVTCAERGTCAPEGATSAGPDAAASTPGNATPGDVSQTSAATIDASGTSTNSDSGTACVTSCPPNDASAASSSTSADGGPSDAQVSSVQTDADACVEICGCEGDECTSSTDPSEAGAPVCSVSQAAACLAPTDICVLNGETPSCVECVVNEDCAAPTGVCVDSRCQVCNLASSEGCDAPTPFCVASGAPGADAGSPSESLTASPADAQAPGTMTDAGSPAAPLQALQCVECRNEGDCGGQTPLCSGGSCVQCLVDTDCTDPDAPRCDTTSNTCAGCNAVGQCSRFDATSACNLNDGKCVECTAAERAACEDFACQTTPGDGQYTCSTQEVDSAGRCEPCLSDAACDTGLACILENFEDTNTEWVCLPRKPENGCGSLRPLSATLSDAVSIDGETGNFCKPPTTTCSAVNHFGSGGLQEPDSCETDDDCGLPGVADGFCLPFRGDENARACTYLCLGNPDCRSGVTCGSSEGTEEVVCSLD